MSRPPKKAPPRPAPVPRAPAKRQRGRTVAAEVLVPELEPEETALALPSPPHTPAVREAGPIRESARQKLMARWMRNRAPDTIRSYNSALRHFALWARRSNLLGLGPRGDDLDAVLALCDLGGARANNIVQDWVDSQAGMSKAGIASRFAAVKSLCIALIAAERTQYVPTGVKIPRRQRRTAMDVQDRYAGIPEAFAKILLGLRAVVAGKHDIYDARDYALLRLGSGMGLRRIELVRLNVGDLSFDTSIARVHGKGRDGPEAMPMPPGLHADLRRWLRERAAVARPAGLDGDPLFVSLGKRNRGGRLTRNTINAIIAARATQFRVKLRPHDMRRILCTDSITELGIYEALKVTRHADVRTLGLYDLGAGEGVANMADRVERRVSARATTKKPARAKKGRNRR